MANGPQDLKDRLDAINQRASAELRLNEILGERSDIVATEARQFATQTEDLKRQLAVLNNIKAAEEELNNLKQFGNQKDQERIQFLEKLTSKTKDEIAAEEKRLRIQYESLKVMQTEREVGLSISQNLFASVGITDKWKNTTFGLAVAAKQTGASFAEIAKHAMRASFSADKLDDVIGSTLMKITESTISLIMATDSSLSSFNRLFGAGGRLNDELFQLSINANQAGLLFSENVELVTSLAQTFDMFLVTSEATRKSLIETAQELHIFGVEAQTSGELFNVLAKSLGQGTSQIQKTATRIMEFGLSVGAAPEQMVQAFNRFLPEFVRYGDRVEDVFQATIKSAKALGTEIETLIGISQNFDTFEDAGVTAGKLMGILGQPVDVMGLMEMDLEPRIRAIIGMIEESGMQAEILNNKFGLLALGDVLKISADEAAKFVRIGVAGYDEHLARQKEIVIAEKERQEQLKAAQTIMQKLQQVMQEFAIENKEAILGLINGIKGFLQAIIDLAGFLKGAFIPVMLTLLFGLKLLAFRYRTAAIAAKSSDVAMRGAGKAAAFAGLKMALVGGAIALAALGVVALIESLKTLSGEQLATMVVHLSAVLVTVLLLTGALIAMAAASVAGLVGFGAMALGLGAVGLALQLIKTEDLVALGNILMGLGALAGGNFPNVGQNLDIVIDKIKNVDSETMDKLTAAGAKMRTATFTPGPSRATGAGSANQPANIKLSLAPGQEFNLKGILQNFIGTGNSVGRLGG